MRPSLITVDASFTWRNTGRDRAVGTGPRRTFRTIQHAAEVAQPGDTVVVHEGVYCERVLPRRGGTGDAPITYTSAPGETVQIKGSELLRTDWGQVHSGIYKGSLPASLFRRTAIRNLEWIDWNSFKEFASGFADGLRNRLMLGQVAVNGKLLTQATDQTMLERTPGSWMAVDDGTAILVHFAEGEPPERAQRRGPANEADGVTPARRSSCPRAGSGSGTPNAAVGNSATRSEFSDFSVTNP